jgi:(E)-4-hydroxy-3-methylbut-2-enyl-diphosphate synthase
MVEPLGTQKARHPSRRIHVGGVAVGGGAPVSVQSMTNTDTRDSGRPWRRSGPGGRRV